MFDRAHLVAFTTGSCPTVDPCVRLGDRRGAGAKPVCCVAPSRHSVLEIFSLFTGDPLLDWSKRSHLALGKHTLTTLHCDLLLACPLNHVSRVVLPAARQRHSDVVGDTRGPRVLSFTRVAVGVAHPPLGASAPNQCPDSHLVWNSNRPSSFRFGGEFEWISPPEVAGGSAPGR